MLVDIPEDVAERLKALAEQQDVDIADLLREMLGRHEAECGAKQKKVVTAADLGRNAEAFVEETRRATAADLGRIAKKAALELDALRQENGESLQPANTAANSREILSEIYAEKHKARADH